MGSTSSRKKIAAHRIILPNETIPMGVLEMEDGVVIGWNKLTEETPMTLWMSGEIEVKSDAQDILRAYRDGKMLI